MTDTYCCGKNKSYHTSTDDYQPDSETTLGGYSTKLVVRQEFVISIPDSLSLEQAVR
jgi:D-arabinose 1-dehydrogenase-like Zn-dependent alcohol dehydrogenase